MITRLRTFYVFMFVAFFLIVGACKPLSAQSVRLELPRHAYYRGETIPITVVSTEEIAQAKIEVTLDSVAVAAAELTGSNVRVDVPTAKVKTGEYALTAIIRAATGQRSASSRVTIARKPSPDRLDVWLWGGSLDCDYYFDHGFTIAGGPHWAYWKEDSRKTYVQSLDARLARGVGATIWLCGGISRRDLKGVDPEAKDVAYLGAGRHEERFFNPFSPIVEKVRRESNHRILTSLGDHPAIEVAFYNTELVDNLWLDNLNREGIELTKRDLGFTRDERGGPTFVAPGVLADDDRKYQFEKYVYQQGNGLAYANQKTAEDLKRHRTDVRALTDPYRVVAYRDMFPGIDLVSTWTYTNNDPKLMLYVETLRAATRNTGQKFMQTVTLLNYPGALAPKTLPSPEGTDPDHEGWMLMGPDRCKEVSWIILSRAPKIIGYYFSSACNPQQYSRPDDQGRVPRATSNAIKELSDRVYVPYGPMITRLNPARRRIAVLSSQASRLYNKSPRTIGYPNEQIYGFYSVLAMAHLQGDVLLDEQVEAGDLKDYDVLAMPRCEVVTESMLKEIRAFQQHGGTILSDQHLGPELADVIRFDFDFNYRLKVNADAIESGVMYAEWDDQLNPKTAELAKATGVTAEEDQRIMESYARQLQEKLAGKVEPEVEIDSPKALLNVLENDGVKYLFIVNDNRTHGDRVGKYRAMLEKLVPLDVNVKLREWDGPLFAYDMLRRKLLPTTPDETGTSFPVELTELGGTIIALYPVKPANLGISMPKSIKRGQPGAMTVTLTDEDGNLLNGLQPLHIVIAEPNGDLSSTTDHYCAESGKLELTLLPAINDAAGSWKVSVEDLTAGLNTEKTFEVR